MKRNFTLFLFLAAICSIANAQSFSKEWSKSVADNAVPTWFGSSTERGIAATSDFVYVVTRNNDDKKGLKYMNAKKGEELNADKLRRIHSDHRELYKLLGSLSEDSSVEELTKLQEQATRHIVECSPGEPRGNRGCSLSELLPDLEGLINKRNRYLGRVGVGEMIS